ncbi:MAG: hypothetical protein EPN86_03345 [Nanoarchaeota archaeon]|nr:MAG: hypothetical protein EPN86_03345 [Nanoarchaeota archaeon]
MGFIQDTVARLERIPTATRNLMFLGILAISVLVLLVLSLGKELFALGLLFILGTSSLAYKRRYKGIPIGIEQVTMTTFVVGKAFGPGIGVIYGPLTAVVGQYILGNDFDADSIPFFFGAGIVGLTAHSLPFPPLLSVLLCSLIVSFCTSLVDFFGEYEQKLYGLLFMVTHFFVTLSLWLPIGSSLLSIAAS